MLLPAQAAPILLKFYRPFAVGRAAGPIGANRLIPVARRFRLCVELLKNPMSFHKQLFGIHDIDTLWTQEANLGQVVVEAPVN